MGSAHIIGSRLRPQHVLHTGRKTIRPVPIHAWKRRTTHKGLGWTSNSRPKTKKSRPEATPTIGPQLTSWDRSTDGGTITRIFRLAAESLLSINDRDRCGRRFGQKPSTSPYKAARLSLQGLRTVTSQASLSQE